MDTLGQWDGNPSELVNHPSKPCTAPTLIEGIELSSFQFIYWSLNREFTLLENYDSWGAGLYFFFSFLRSCKTRAILQQRLSTNMSKYRMRDSMEEVLVDRGNGAEAQVVGSTQLFKDGKLQCIPMPTPDPKDPLNLPEWRKWAAIITLSLFGALALSAETIVGALVPIFVLEYAGIDPKILGKIDLSTLNLSSVGGKPADPIQLLNSLGGPPISKVDLISTLPILVNGIASYILVPLSIGVGRRPVILFSGVMAWAGGLWAGFSTSLNSHIAARVFQGFGAGAVEALIPLILQDMLFINQRNKAFSLISAGQGLFVVSIGLTSPLIIINLSWRWLYYITAGAGIIVWIAMIFFVPETRWERSQDELGM